MGTTAPVVTPAEGAMKSKIIVYKVARPTATNLRRI
jgi:hypothetical protein